MRTFNVSTQNNVAEPNSNNFKFQTGKVRVSRTNASSTSKKETNLIIALTRTEMVYVMASIGKDGWFTYSVLRALASKNAVRINQSDLAKLLGKSSKTVSRNIHKLSTVMIQDQPLMIVRREFEGNVYTLCDLCVKK